MWIFHLDRDYKYNVSSCATIERLRSNSTFWSEHFLTHEMIINTDLRSLLIAVTWDLSYLEYSDRDLEIDLNLLIDARDSLYNL